MWPRFMLASYSRWAYPSLQSSLSPTWENFTDNSTSYPVHIYLGINPVERNKSYF